MRVRGSRIWQRYGQLDPKDEVQQEKDEWTGLDTGTLLGLKSYRKTLVSGFQESARQRVNEGYDPYLIDFMFRQLPGGQKSIREQMRQEIERAYAKLAMQFDDHPGSEGREHRLPLMLLFPGLPVFKHKKKSIRDVSINEGPHYDGIVLTPPKSKFRERLEDYFTEKQHIYRTDKLERIDVSRARYDDVEHITDYAAKTFKRGHSDYDAVDMYDATIILPKSVSELPGKGPWRYGPLRVEEPTSATDFNRAKTGPGYGTTASPESRCQNHAEPATQRSDCSPCSWTSSAT